MTRKPIFAAIVLLILSPLTIVADFSGSYRPVIDEIITTVEKHFYDSARVSNSNWKSRARQLQAFGDTATSADQVADSINTLLGSLKASHTHYFTKNDPKRYQLLGVFSTLFDQSHDNLFVYEGIGIDTRRNDERFVILSVFDGFPAKEAGLKFGDTIVAVDGKKFHPILSFKEKTGKTAVVEVVRQGKTTPITVKVVKIDGRTMFKRAAESSVESIENHGKKIGYIHLWSYAGSDYQELLCQQVLWGDLSKCDALVLDIRDGWGGADLSYLNLFRPPILSTSFRSRDGSTGTYNGAWEKPVALLVNERSTSGKELFAYGFKKAKFGPVVGTTTAGAVLAGRVFLLSNEDVLYLAVNDVSVDGKPLEGRGVTPTIAVERSMNTDAGDSQLRKAVEEVTKLIK
ncbi:MAG TPA: S41 family peptidase [Chitinispirillaceae bacterium]|nr:S41 family peptidase [Chitinispirillaceae bacterium]